MEEDIKKSKLMEIRQELRIDAKKARDDMLKSIGYMRTIYDSLENLALLVKEEHTWVAEMRDFLQAHYEESDTEKLRTSVDKSLKFVKQVTPSIQIARRRLRQNLKHEENVMAHLEQSFEVIGDLIDAINKQGGISELIHEEAEKLKEEIGYYADYNNKPALRSRKWMNEQRREREENLKELSEKWSNSGTEMFSSITVDLTNILSSLHTVDSALGLVGAETEGQREELGKIEKYARIINKVLKQIKDAGAKDMYKAKQLLTDELPTELVKELKEINTFEEARIEFGNTLNELFTAIKRLKPASEKVFEELTLIVAILASGSADIQTSKVNITQRNTDSYVATR